MKQIMKPNSLINEDKMLLDTKPLDDYWAEHAMNDFQSVIDKAGITVEDISMF